MKITEKLSRRVTNIIVIVITITTIFCENQALRHGALIGCLAMLAIISTGYTLTNRPIKKSDKISLICVYIIFILGLLYVFIRNFK